MDIFNNLKEVKRPAMDIRIDRMLERMEHEERVDNTLTCTCKCGQVFKGNPLIALDAFNKHKKKCKFTKDAKNVPRRSEKYSITENQRIQARMIGMSESAKGRPKDKWTKEEVLDSIRAFTEKIGHTPSYDEARAAKMVPSDWILTRLFGRPGPWKTAVIEAGLEPNERGRPKKNES